MIFNKKFMLKKMSSTTSDTINATSHESEFVTLDEFLKIIVLSRSINDRESEFSAPIPIF